MLNESRIPAAGDAATPSVSGAFIPVASSTGSLFGRPSGLVPIFKPVTLVSGRPQAEVAKVVEQAMVTALIELIRCCHAALSSFSREGRKGELLAHLLRAMNEPRSFRRSDIDHVVLELVRVTAAYTSTIFCQAPYAKSRSALVLIAALKDADINQQLPLCEILFGQNTFNQVTQEPEAAVASRLEGLRATRHWDSVANKMLFRVFPEAPPTVMPAL